MNLISCDNCGVVLDKSKVSFPSSIYTEEGVDETKGTYSQNQCCWVAYIKCPVCGEKIGEVE